ncbi:hypothetical protein BGY98DRAFT_410240 [Russula aff. rugulosa BPL654]|nr:hypothetical protein BGY98DRAFT_410240 [Russula aff. rugulosa BPL654]
MTSRPQPPPPQANSGSESTSPFGAGTVRSRLVSVASLCTLPATSSTHSCWSAATENTPSNATPSSPVSRRALAQQTEVSRERTRAPLQEILAFRYSQTIHAAAIGHYITAILADPSEPTFFLNRAAAYLKLSKNEDAESDCTTVVSLSNKNVKALFLRVQACTALQKLGEAHNSV